MVDATPSRTALRVATLRAAHQLIDSPRVFDDPLALRILGPEVAEKISPGHRSTALPALRAFLVARSRYAEEQIGIAVAAGIRQCVILGAGLDTFAYRNPYPELRVFEVDHPATQVWKRERLAVAGIPIPEGVTFAGADFEHQTLGEALAATGFPCDEPSIFSWLGVVPYLTIEAFTATMRYIVSLPTGSSVVFDYAVDRECLGGRDRIARDIISDRVAAAGEPFRLFFHPVDIEGQLRSIGFSRVDDLSPDDMNARYFDDRPDGLRLSGGLGHLIHAQR